MMRHWLACLLLLTIGSHVVAQEVPNARPPEGDAQTRAWLENMIWHHQFTDHEIRRATGWTFDEIDTHKAKYDIRADNRPERESSSLHVLPYPGGRHPRIGFLEGAIEPQRETKVSIFAPWDASSYVVADVPEAVWSNLGLTYLAHTHIDTVWDAQGLKLAPQEWEIDEDNNFRCVRELPNGIVIDSQVLPADDHVRFTMTLTNGTEDVLSDLRVQNCVMLKGAIGFEEQGNANKLLVGPYATCHNDSKDRWIITAWLPLHRCWANERCPCLHSDPKFPDCEPGQTVKIEGWLSFYEGNEIETEIERIKSLKWWE